jgi:hypothetical protein
MAVSPDGTAWVAGAFEGTVTFWAGQPGETTRTASGWDFYLLKIGPDGALLRFITVTDSCGPTERDGGMWGSGVAALPNGSVLVTGGFSKEITIGSTTLRAAGHREMFLARFDADGSPRWAVGTSGPCNPTQVTCGGSTDPACIHSYSGYRVEVLPDGRSRVLLGTGGLIAAYSAAGAPEWLQLLARPLPPRSHGWAVLTDGSGFVVGDFHQIVRGPNGGQIDRFSSDGKLLWTRRVPKEMVPNEMSHYGARAVLAFEDGSAIVGGSTSTQELIRYGVHSPYLARFEANGDLAWFRAIPAKRSQWVHSSFGPAIEQLAPVSSGGFVLVGQYMVEADTTGEGACGRKVTGDGSLLLARYDAAGALLWSKIEGGVGPAAATFPDGTTLVGAHFEYSLTLGRGEPNETTLTGRAESGRYHAFVARFGP